ncbi:hypothetical protein CRYUN_Cryun01aG0186200 [Craigia yunnanensis]
MVQSVNTFKSQLYGFGKQIKPIRAIKGKAEAHYVGKFLKMENHNEKLFREVFGESSDSEDNDPQPKHKQTRDPIPSWEQMKEINGLWLCRDFLSPQHQSSLISAVLNEGWLTEVSHNQFRGHFL